MSFNNCSVLFSALNLIDKAVEIGPYGAATSQFPVSNLAKEEMYLFFRMTAAGGNHLVYDFTRSDSVQVVGLIKNLFSSTSRWRIRLANTEAELTTTPLFDSTMVDMFPGIDLFGIDPWGEFDWGGFAYDVYMGDYNRQAIYVLPNKVIARYMRIDFEIDETLTELGYGQAARLWVGDGYQPEFSATYGSGIRLIDETQIKVSESGIKHRNKRRVKRRGMRIILENEAKTELFYKFMGPILAAKGSSTDFLTLLEPQDKATLAFQTIYGSLADRTVTVSHSVWNRASTSFDLEESI